MIELVKALRGHGGKLVTFGGKWRGIFGAIWPVIP
jgi:hypothetical protein